MEEQIRHILKALGEDPDREGLLKTPYRVAQALTFLTQGYQQDPAKVINDALFTEDYEEMIVQRDIDFYSLCEHHLLPFFGKAHVAYIPHHKIVGYFQTRPFGRCLRSETPGSGTADEPDRQYHYGEARSAWRGRRHRGRAPVHENARG